MTLPSTVTSSSFLPAHLKKELDIDLPINSGSSKSLVRLVQERLHLAGYRLRIDGDFGPATAHQLKSFQQAAGFAQSGSYGTSEHDALTAPFVNAIKPIVARQRTMGN